MEFTLDGMSGICTFSILSRDFTNILWMQILTPRFTSRITFVVVFTNNMLISYGDSTLELVLEVVYQDAFSCFVFFIDAIILIMCT